MVSEREKRKEEAQAESRAREQARRDRLEAERQERIRRQEERNKEREAEEERKRQEINQRRADFEAQRGIGIREAEIRTGVRAEGILGERFKETGSIIQQTQAQRFMEQQKVINEKAGTQQEAKAAELQKLSLEKDKKSIISAHKEEIARQLAEFEAGRRTKAPDVLEDFDVVSSRPVTRSVTAGKKGILTTKEGTEFTLVKDAPPIEQNLAAEFDVDSGIIFVNPGSGLAGQETNINVIDDKGLSKSFKALIKEKPLGDVEGEETSLTVSIPQREEITFFVPEGEIERQNLISSFERKGTGGKILAAGGSILVDFDVAGSGLKSLIGKQSGEEFVGDVAEVRTRFAEKGTLLMNIQTGSKAALSSDAVKAAAIGAAFGGVGGTVFGFGSKVAPITTKVVSGAVAASFITERTITIGGKFKRGEIESGVGEILRTSVSLGFGSLSFKSQFKIGQKIGQTRLGEGTPRVTSSKTLVEVKQLKRTEFFKVETFKGVINERIEPVLNLEQRAVLKLIPSGKFRQDVLTKFGGETRTPKVEGKFRSDLAITDIVGTQQTTQSFSFKAFGKNIAFVKTDVIPIAGKGFAESALIAQKGVKLGTEEFSFKARTEGTTFVQAGKRFAQVKGITASGQTASLQKGTLKLRLTATKSVFEISELSFFRSAKEGALLQNIPGAESGAKTITLKPGKFEAVIPKGFSGDSGLIRQFTKIKNEAFGTLIKAAASRSTQQSTRGLDVSLSQQSASSIQGLKAGVKSLSVKTNAPDVDSIRFTGVPSSKKKGQLIFEDAEESLLFGSPTIRAADIRLDAVGQLPIITQTTSFGQSSRFRSSLLRGERLKEDELVSLKPDIRTDVGLLPGQGEKLRGGERQRERQRERQKEQQLGSLIQLQTQAASSRTRIRTGLRLRSGKVPEITIPKTDITGFGLDKLGKAFPGFIPEVRIKGKFVKVSDIALTKKEAFALGSQIVGGTSARSFRLRKADTAAFKGVINFKAPKLQLRRAKREKNVFVEKTEFAINAPKEFQEITEKGIQALKIRGFPSSRKSKSKKSRSKRRDPFNIF